MWGIIHRWCKFVVPYDFYGLCIISFRSPCPFHILWLCYSLSVLYIVLSLTSFPAPIRCFEFCYLVLGDVVVLCLLLIGISLLFSILLFLRVLLLCYGFVQEDIKLVYKFIFNSCNAMSIDCLHLRHNNIFPVDRI